MSDLVARFRAEADQDAAFESAMRLVKQTTAEVERLRADHDRLVELLVRAQLAVPDFYTQWHDAAHATLSARLR